MIGARGRPISSMQPDAIANGSPVADGAVGGSDFKGIPVPKTESAALGGSSHHPKTESTGSWWLAPPPQNRIGGSWWLAPPPKAESMGSWWLAPPPESGIDGLLVARATTPKQNRRAPGGSSPARATGRNERRRQRRTV